MSILQRIDERLTALDMSRRKASLAAGLGPDYIRDLARRKNASPGLRAVEKLAPVLETTVEWLSGGEALPEVEGIYRPPLPVLGELDLPVYRSVEGGPGVIVVSEKAIAHIPRPAKLANNPDAFAVVVDGESMSPEYESGDMLFVDPYKPLTRERNFIFVDDRQGDWKACVKRLVRWDQKTFHVYQHNPAEGQRKEFALKRAEWPKAMRVIGKIDRD
jgi:SOS-response transcriptional repressor LexA